MHSKTMKFVNVESLTWFVFLQHNFKGNSCTDFHTFLKIAYNY